MIASENTIQFISRLTLISVFVWVTNLSAQQPSGETDKTSLPAEELSESQAATDRRHIDRLGDVKTEDWEMDLALPSPASVDPPAGSESEIFDDAQNQALQQLLTNLAANPGNTELFEQLTTLLTEFLDQANRMIEAGLLDQAEQMLSFIQSIDPDLRGINIAVDYLNNLNEINELQASLVEQALASARELDFETATAWLLEASAVGEDQTRVEETRVEVAMFKQARADELELKAITAMDTGNFDLANFSIIDLIALGGQQARVLSLRTRLEEARYYGGFAPGQIIRDELLKSGGKAPEIVIIAAGSFLMGSRASSIGANANEKPQHRVTIERGFGLGVREVTVAEFRLFIERSGYRTAAERSEGSTVYAEAAGRLNQRDGVDWEYDYSGKKANSEMPVLHVNVHDAKAYVQWLALETGKSYRLPSEAEYEYVASAGGGGTYWWGKGSPKVTVENLTGDRDQSPSDRQWTTAFKKYGDGHWGPAHAGSLRDDKMVHPMGVYDIAGNVSEWTEDCWHQNYVKAPVDGSAWVNPGCKRRVVRGGHWASSPAHSRAVFRISAKAETFGPIVGIRIARDL
jgi:formylglycine-generating enzyme required for sulfatase activity